MVNKLFFYRLPCFLAEGGMIKAVYWNTFAGIPSCPKTKCPMKSLEQSLFTVTPPIFIQTLDDESRMLIIKLNCHNSLNKLYICSFFGKM